MSTSAPVQSSVWYNDGMAQFAGKTIMTVIQLAIGYNAAAHTSTQRNHDEIFHAPGSTVHHFAHRSSVGIIGKAGTQAKSFSNHFRQGDNPFPRQVWCVLYGSFVIVAVGCSHSYALYF